MLKVMTDAGISEAVAQFNLTLHEACTNPKSNQKNVQNMVKKNALKKSFNLNNDNDL